MALQILPRLGFSRQRRQVRLGFYQTGIKGVRDVVGMDPNKIHKVIMDETHGFTTT